VLKWAFTSFIWSFFTVITVGIFPIVFSIIYNYNKQLRKYGMEIAVNKLESENETLHTLLADNQKDKLVLKGKDLLYIESADNYAHVFHLKEAELRNDLLRGSLSRMEEFLNDEDIARCHRSFIVNLNLVDRVSGNAQGYKLHLRDIDKLIPVARKYSHLIERFK
jgi:DNA-binding LytR/AlgR family response regulator